MKRKTRLIRAFLILTSLILLVNLSSCKGLVNEQPTVEETSKYGTEESTRVEETTHISENEDEYYDRSMSRKSSDDVFSLIVPQMKFSEVIQRIGKPHAEGPMISQPNFLWYSLEGNCYLIWFHFRDNMPEHMLGEEHLDLDMIQVMNYGQVGGCICISDTSETTTTNSDEEENSMENSTTSDLSGLLGTDDGLYIDEVSVSAQNIEEYEDFIDNTELPDYFVYYDEFSSLGIFKSFTDISNSLVGDFTALYYSLIDENGFKFALYTRKDYNSTPVLTGNISKNSFEDLRKKESTASPAYYELDGLVYNYINGKLTGIYWHVDDIEYMIYSTSLSEYPSSGKDTVISKLLNSQTAVDAAKNVIKEK